MNTKHPSVIVIGAGIVGSSIAYHLSCQNASVVLIDKAPRPGHEVTKQSFGWITAAHDVPNDYFKLRQQAITDWHRLERELNGRLNVNWSGALTWFQESADTKRIGDELIKLNDKVRFVDRQNISLLEPNLKNVPYLAIFAESEGAVDSKQCTETLVEAAREVGGSIQLWTEVLGIITNGSKVSGVMTNNGPLDADVVVLATGADAAQLCQPLDLQIPINKSPAILMRFQTDTQFVNRIVSNPLMEIRAASNRLLLAAEEYIDESTENSPMAIAQRTLKSIQNEWHWSASVKLLDVAVGQRPMPIDGLPIIGSSDIDGLYLSVMHTGVTFAPLIGRFAASEILSANTDPLLASFRLGRFFEK